MRWAKESAREVRRRGLERRRLEADRDQGGRTGEDGGEGEGEMASAWAVD